MKIKQAELLLPLALTTLVLNYIGQVIDMVASSQKKQILSVIGDYRCVKFFIHHIIWLN